MRYELEQYGELVKVLSETLGNTFEVGLLDLTDSTYPEIAVAHNHSKVQEKIRSFVLKTVNTPWVQAKKQLINRPLQLDARKLIKVSVFFLRNGEGCIIGALWIGMRTDLFMRMEGFVNSMLQFCTQDLDLQAVEEADRSVSSGETSLDSIQQMASEFGIEPGRSTLAERQELICDLYDIGVYNLKGAVAKTAEVLGISEQSVYRYISRIKKARDW